MASNNQQWEMYEAMTFIGVRDKATLRKVCAVPLGPTDFDIARLIEAAPELRISLERCIAALEACGATNCEAAKEARAVLVRCPRPLKGEQA